MEIQGVKVTTTADIIRIADEHQEVVLNVSVYQPGSRAETIKRALQYAGADLTPELFNMAYCVHHWVLADPDAKTCSLGCEHNNWSDRDRLLAEKIKVEAPTPETMDREAFYAIHGILNVYGKGLVEHLSHKSYEARQQAYYKIWDSLHQIRASLGQQMSAVREGRDVLPKFEVWYGDKSMRCNSIDDLKTICLGLKLQGHEYKIYQLRDSNSGYAAPPEPLDTGLACYLCNKPMESEMQLLENRLCHAACVELNKAEAVIKIRSFNWTPGSPIRYDVCAEPGSYNSLFYVVQEMMPHWHKDLLVAVNKYYTRKGETFYKIRVKTDSFTTKSLKEWFENR